MILTLTHNGCDGGDDIAEYNNNTDNDKTGDIWFKYST